MDGRVGMLSTVDSILRIGWYRVLCGLSMVDSIQHICHGDGRVFTLYGRWHSTYSPICHRDDSVCGLSLVCCLQ